MLLTFNCYIFVQEKWDLQRTSGWHIHIWRRPRSDWV